jgi:hypothetical protein
MVSKKKRNKSGWLCCSVVNGQANEKTDKEQADGRKVKNATVASCQHVFDEYRSSPLQLVPPFSPVES